MISDFKTLHLNNTNLLISQATFTHSASTSADGTCVDFNITGFKTVDVADHQRTLNLDIYTMETNYNTYINASTLQTYLYTTILKCILLSSIFKDKLRPYLRAATKKENQSREYVPLREFPLRKFSDCSIFPFSPTSQNPFTEHSRCPDVAATPARGQPREAT